MVLGLPKAACENAVKVCAECFRKGGNGIAFLEFELASKDVVGQEAKNSLFFLDRSEIARPFGQNQERPDELLVGEAQLLIRYKCL